MSDVTSETLQFAIDLAAEPIIKDGERTWLKHDYTEIAPPLAEPKNFFSLTSFCEFTEMLEVGREGGAWIHVLSPTHVELVSLLDERKRREIYATARPKIEGQFVTNMFHTQETFVTNLQAYFEDYADREKLLKVVGNLRGGAHVILEDDGMTQQVETAKGVISKAKETLPNPVMLCPYVTFAEVGPQPRKYIVRLRGDADHQPEIALFAVPNPVFDYEVCGAIKAWLQENLGEPYCDRVFG